MRVHIVSETEFITGGHGIHSAFLDHIDLLDEIDDVDVIVNGEGKGDVLHSHTYGPYFFWKGWQYKGRRLISVHVVPEAIAGSFPMQKYWLPFLRWYLKQVYSFADVCIAISPQTEKAVKELSNSTRIVRINTPINLNKWEFSNEKRRIGRRLLGLKPDEFVVLGVGKMQQEKGIDDFITVAGNIPKARFVWVGSRNFGRLTESVRTLDYRTSHSPANVKFVGVISPIQMPYVYAAADVLLYTPYNSNSIIVPLEAAACGIPVVFRDLDEYTQIFSQRYLKVADNKGFTEVVQNLQSDKEFYEIASNISKKLILQFDRELIRQQLIKLYTELIENNRSTNQTREIRFLEGTKDKTKPAMTAAYRNMLRNNLIKHVWNFIHKMPVWNKHIRTAG
ncbi:MAG TPA: glycosyltransferase [Bacteroidales bacterium]|nr:glycosyltransferase [Bacteroidales bacterium]